MRNITTNMFSFHSESVVFAFHFAVKVDFVDWVLIFSSEAEKGDLRQTEGKKSAVAFLVWIN